MTTPLWRILLLWLGGVLLGFSLGVCAVRQAEAFEPPNERLYPPLQYKSAIIEAIQVTRTATWQAVDNYGYPGWRGLIAEALDTGSADPNSLGNILSAAVPSFAIREAVAGETPMVLQVAESAAAQQTHCNDPEGWSTACAYLLNPLPAPLYYKANAMLTYIRSGQKAVVQHETFHGVGRACDQYVGGCPPTNAQPVRCTGNPDTLMDCGLGARFAQPFDVDTFLLATGFERAPVDCSGETDIYGNTWNACTGRWVSPSGWTYDPNTRICYRPDGIAEWGECKVQDNDCWNLRLAVWVFRGSLLFDPAAGLFSAPPLP